MEAMRTVPAPHAAEAAGYALGVVRHRWVAGGNADLFDHGGGGFGFLSDLWWAPQLELGIAVLTNSADHRLQGDLALSILRDLTREPGSDFHDRLLGLPIQASAADPDGRFQPPAGLAQRVVDLAMPATGNELDRWAGYAGAYKPSAWGVIDPVGVPARFVIESGVPYFEANDGGSPGRYRLTEIEAGLFLAENGETLDLRGQPATWRSFELVRASGGPTSWQWVLLGATALVAIWWLLAALVATVRRRRRRGGASDDRATRYRGWRVATGAAAVLTASFTLGSIALLAALPGLVDSGFLGWLELPLPQRLMLHIPLGLTLAVGCLVVLTVFGWTSGRLARAVRLRSGALVVSSVVLAGQLAAWHLIGWGLT